ncbi:MAG: 23S rRNA (uracil(1939)-C(5))-methyltransferase RlmD [Lachnospiraceae bacterium]|nr:23S rRNA (uracil(1939)-C(5))-methyltransferase RlmD [Lachnospiraceae bacterium]
MKKNDEFEIDITDIGNDGEGIGKYDGMTFFIKGGLPGDRILAGATKLKKTYGYARLVKVITPSPFRVNPPCPIAGKCGGCQLQNISYEKQLEIKESKVFNDIIRLGKVDPGRINQRDGSLIENSVIFHRIIGMENTLHYRNKGQFPVGSDKEGNIITGFYAGHTHSIISTEKCMIQHELTDYIMKTVRDFMVKFSIPAYEEPKSKENLSRTLKRKNPGKNNGIIEKNGHGLVRHILTRVGFRTHEVMVCIVINGKELPHWEELKNLLVACIENYNRDLSENAMPYYNLTSFSLNINTENTNVILGAQVKTLYGKPYFTDYIGDLEYRISPLSFYQVNPVQTLKLYSTALEYAQKKDHFKNLTADCDVKIQDKVALSDELYGKTIWDLYCGIGTISLFMAQKAKKVFGVEIVPQAIEDAKKNAEINGIKNVEFICGAAEEVMPQKLRENPDLKADVIVVDPPRKGCDETLLKAIVKMEPERIVYVSCDPATLSRDIAYLEEQGFILKEVQPVDQFPYSSHVETCCLLTKCRSDEYCSP